VSTVHDAITLFLEDPKVVAVQVICYDFSKAFDKLGHNVIIKRLLDCNFPSLLINWVADYLNGRLQHVRVGNHISNGSLVTSGVPQGSVIGPFLFAMVTGSFAPLDPSSVCSAIYADDFYLVLAIYKNSLNEHVKMEHNNLVHWSNNQKLNLNFNKCKSLCVSSFQTRGFSGIPLPGIDFVTSHKILGVIFNESLSWNSHIDYITSLAAKRLYALRVLRPVLSDSELRLVYTSLIRSLLEYACPVFIGLNSQLSDQINKIQIRAHRIFCSNPACSVSMQCIPDLSSRRNTLSSKLMCRILADKSHILHSLAPVVGSSGRRLILAHCKSTRRLKSFFPCTTIIVNSNL